MTALAFIVEMTKALAWPLAVFGILVIYRKTLPNLVERIRSLKYGNFEAAFADQTTQVAENISSTSQSLSGSASTDRKLLSLAQQSPRAAVLEAWLQIEQRLHALAASAGMEAKPRSSITELLHSLRGANAITAETERALLGLSQLRNLAVHAPGEELSTQKAIDFITLAGALLWTLDVPPKN